jgi:hypothetical protein
LPTGAPRVFATRFYQGHARLVRRFGNLADCDVAGAPCWVSLWVEPDTLPSPSPTPTRSVTLFGPRTTVHPVAGTALFQDLHITTASAGLLRLCARVRLPQSAVPSPPSGCSDAFEVVAAHAASLLIISGPSPVARAGERMPPLVVRVVDAFGNGGANGTLGMSVLADAEPLGPADDAPLAAAAEVAGMAALPDISGLARFERMVIGTPGRFALRFSLGALPPVTSLPFIVRSRAKALVFTEPPPACADAGRGFRVAVELRDASGGVAEADAGTVRISSYGWDFSVGGTTEARAATAAALARFLWCARIGRQVAVLNGVAVFEAVTLYMATDSTHHAYALPTTIQLQAELTRWQCPCPPVPLALMPPPVRPTPSGPRPPTGALVLLAGAPAPQQACAHPRCAMHMSTL